MGYVVEEIDPTLEPRLDNLENNEYKILYFQTISSATGTISKPTGSTIILDQFYSGGDAIVETLSNGQPTGQSPLTVGGSVVSVSSFDLSGNYTLSGTPSSYPVALIYILKIKAIDYSSLSINNIMQMENINFENVTNKSDSYTVSSSVTYATTKALVDGLATKGTIKGSVITNAGSIPFATGVSDTLTSSLNQVFVDSNKRMQLGNTSGTTWDYHAYAFDAGTNSIVYGSSGDFHLVSNARGLGTWTRYSAGKAINQYMYDGDMVTRTAGTSSAGSSITWIEQFKVKNTGGIGVNSKSYFGDTTTTATAYVDIAPSNSGNAPMRFRSGTAPTSPNDGDIWYDGVNLKMRVGGTTKTFTLV